MERLPFEKYPRLEELIRAKMAELNLNPDQDGVQEVGILSPSDIDLDIPPIPVRLSICRANPDGPFDEYFVVDLMEEFKENILDSKVIE